MVAGVHLKKPLGFKHTPCIPLAYPLSLVNVMAVNT